METCYEGADRIHTACAYSDVSRAYSSAGVGRHVLRCILLYSDVFHVYPDMSSEYIRIQIGYIQNTTVS